MANYYKSVYDLPNDAKSLRQCSPDPANLSSSKAQVGAIHVNPVVLQESVHRVPKKHRSTFFAKKVSLYVVLILVLCFAAICLIVARNKYDHGYRNGYDSGYTIGYDNGYKVGTYAPQSSEESSSVASETASEEPTVANEPIPVPEPASGAILSGRRYDSQSEITITADALSSYVVKLKGVGGSDILSFYVRSGDTITVAVPPKQMYVYFASGTTWYGKDSLFGENTFYSKDDELLDFSQYTFSYTLYPVSNGNFSETPIDASEFN